MSVALVAGAFDDLRSRDVRFLQEAARLGEVSVLLWSDERVRAATGAPPRFGYDERRYLVGALRWVRHAHPYGDDHGPDALPDISLEVLKPDVWVVRAEEDTPGRRAFCRARGVAYHVLDDACLAGFPARPAEAVSEPDRPRVVVTGCFDWFHSGHVRFLEEAATHGELHAIVGHDANIRLLKGEGHPLFPEEERCYMVDSVRHVHRAHTSTGHGWIDAAPEIERLRPAFYVVNEDGDRPEKRAFCAERSIGYVVLEREPKEGLPSRRSTDLRGY
ncbi:MAG TPA: adenylyltransferase/cytidyltransferase family protein [Chthonomonadales bacterium]|nr:adenylyltransferase/cytidyltransferase family protein [Chthonomonadales bacterium]